MIVAAGGWIASRWIEELGDAEGVEPVSEDGSGEGERCSSGEVLGSGRASFSALFSAAEVVKCGAAGCVSVI